MISSRSRNGSSSACARATHGVAADEAGHVGVALVASHRHRDADGAGGRGCAGRGEAGERDEGDGVGDGGAEELVDGDDDAEAGILEAADGLALLCLGGVGRAAEEERVHGRNVLEGHPHRRLASQVTVQLVRSRQLPSHPPRAARPRPRQLGSAGHDLRARAKEAP